MKKFKVFAIFITLFALLITTCGCAGTLPDDTEALPETDIGKGITDSALNTGLEFIPYLLRRYNTPISDGENGAYIFANIDRPNNAALITPLYLDYIKMEFRELRDNKFARTDLSEGGFFSAAGYLWCLRDNVPTDKLVRFSPYGLERIEITLPDQFIWGRSGIAADGNRLWFLLADTNEVWWEESIFSLVQINTEPLTFNVLETFTLQETSIFLTEVNQTGLIFSTYETSSSQPTGTVLYPLFGDHSNEGFMEVKEENIAFDFSGSKFYVDMPNNLVYYPNTDCYLVCQNSQTGEILNVISHLEGAISPRIWGWTKEYYLVQTGYYDTGTWLMRNVDNQTLFPAYSLIKKSDYIRDNPVYLSFTDHFFS